MPKYDKYTSVALNNPQDTSEHTHPLVVNGDSRRDAEERICVACGDHTIYMSEEEAYRLAEILLKTLEYIEDEEGSDSILS